MFFVVSSSVLAAVSPEAAAQEQGKGKGKGKGRGKGKGEGKGKRDDAAAPGSGVEAPRIVGPVETLAVDDALCARLQQPWKPELTRGHYRADCGEPGECVKRHLNIHAWRTRHYGYYKGFGSTKDNGYAPSHYTRTITLWGMKLTINEHLIAPLRCVEREVASGCATCTPREELPNECSAKKFPYRPHALSGLRTKNTFRGGEVSNHVYGIAIDLDPAENTCCGCVGKWKRHPMCKKPLPPHERMIMPYCWVEAFERYGFYWLGRDKLQDTMHFEFLGDPSPVREAVNAALSGAK